MDFPSHFAPEKRAHKGKLSISFFSLYRPEPPPPISYPEVKVNSLPIPFLAVRCGENKHQQVHCPFYMPEKGVCLGRWAEGGNKNKA